MEAIRVLIVDDHLVVREGLRTLMEGNEGISVVGAAEDGVEALAKAQELVPDVVLMDIRMPRMDGLEATRRLKDLLPATSVIMISVYDNDTYVIEAIRAGASGYILKDVSADLLVHTVKAVSAGGVLLKSSLLRRALESAASPKAWERTDSRPIPEAPSPREQDVLRLMVEGLTNKQIAGHLYLAEDTVKKHVQSLIAKLQASDRTQAAVKAVRAGMVPEGPESFKSNQRIPQRALDPSNDFIRLEKLGGHTQIFPPVLPAQILQAAADDFGMDKEALLGRGRTKRLAYVRGLVVHLMRELSGLSFAEIGKHLGDRDHSTVIRLHRTIDSKRKTGSSVESDRRRLETRICNRLASSDRLFS